MFSKREHKILTTLVNNPDGMFGKQLSTVLEVSDRTIRSDIANINKMLMKFDCMIASTKRRGYYIELKFLSNIHQLLLEDDNSTNDETEERKYSLLGKILFARADFEIFELADQMFISEQTLYKDLKFLQNDLLVNFSIDLFDMKEQKIILKTPETSIRILFFKLSKIEILKNQEYIPFTLKLICGRLFDKKRFDNLSQTIRNYSHSNDTTFTTESLYMLSWAIYFSLLREDEEFYLTDQYAINHPESKKYIFAEIIEYLNKNKIKISDEGAILLQRYLKTLGLINVDKNITVISDTGKFIVNDFKDEILKKYGFDISTSENLYNHLSLHLDIMLHRINENLQSINPIKKEIKMKYPYAYEIAILIAPIVYHYKNIYLTDDEISYLAIFIQNYVEINNMRLRTIIISGSGIGITNLVQNWVKTNLSDCLEIVDSIPSYKLSEFLQDSSIELIISTIPVDIKTDAPVVAIRGLPDQSDLERIRYWVKQVKIIKRTEHVIQKVFSSRMIKTYVQKQDFEQVIKDLTLLLYKENKIKNPHKFLEDVISREKMYPTLINQSFMIPHPLNETSLENAVAIAILKEGLIDNDRMRCIFLLALSDENSQDTEIVFHLIHMLGSDSEGFMEVIKDEYLVVNNLIKVAERN